MFDLDPGKLIVIGIVALIAIPSKDLPRVMRALGQAMGKMRRMSAEFQGQFMDAMREMESADLRKEIEETNKAIMNSAFDPLTEARKQITGAIEDGATPGAEADPDAAAAYEAALQNSFPHPDDTPPPAAPRDEAGESPEGAADRKASS